MWAMKFRCIYCTHAFDADALPPACPGCSRTFTLTVGPYTTVKQLVRALANNGAIPSFDLLRAALPEEHAPEFALACAPDTDTHPRPAGCACHIEPGDSPCPVHGDDEP